MTVLSGQPISMQDITYPEAYVQSMTGDQLKAIMEDVCDNLFNLDPCYQQGGDMVRLAGMSYTCAPNETIGKRISGLKLADGSDMEAAKSYRVAGWASVDDQKGAPVWETVADYLHGSKRVAEAKGRGVVLRGVDGNPGFAGQG